MQQLAKQLAGSSLQPDSNHRQLAEPTGLGTPAPGATPVDTTYTDIPLHVPLASSEQHYTPLFGPLQPAELYKLDKPSATCSAADSD